MLLGDFSLLDLNESRYEEKLERVECEKRDFY